MVPSIAVMLREGNLALALFGRIRKVHEPAFSLAAGRRSVALKRILEAFLIIFCLASLIRLEAYFMAVSKPAHEGSCSSLLANS